MSPNRLILEVGAGSVEKPLKGTVTQIRAAVRRYAETLNIATTGMTDAEVGRAVLDRFALSVKEASMAKQRTEKFAELAASIEAQLQSENDIYEPPP